MKVGDLVYWVHGNPDNKPFEMGIIIYTDESDNHIKVVDLHPDRMGDTEWWDSRDWKLVEKNV
tara:strand:- start:7570 stop:7758 length:189 start_codon:yes stop_codon:yes gene_type:complete